MFEEMPLSELQRRKFHLKVENETANAGRSKLKNDLISHRT